MDPGNDPAQSDARGARGGATTGGVQRPCVAGAGSGVGIQGPGGRASGGSSGVVAIIRGAGGSLPTSTQLGRGTELCTSAGDRTGDRRSHQPAPAQPALRGDGALHQPSGWTWRDGGGEPSSAGRTHPRLGTRPARTDGTDDGCLLRGGEGDRRTAGGGHADRQLARGESTDAVCLLSTFDRLASSSVIVD